MPIIDTVGLSNFFGIHRNTVFKWVKEGMPYTSHQRGKEGYKFDSASVCKWREARALAKATSSIDEITVDEARRRKLSAEAGLAELELAKQKSLVADLEEVERALANEYAELTSRLRKTPERCALRILGDPTEANIKKVILEEIDECLNDYTE